MKQTVLARTLDNGLIEPHHEIEVVCSACGYDLDEAELQADVCSDSIYLSMLRLFLLRAERYFKLSYGRRTGVISRC
jgi:hypothetical protein